MSIFTICSSIVCDYLFIFCHLRKVLALCIFLKSNKYITLNSHSSTEQFLLVKVSNSELTTLWACDRFLHLVLYTAERAWSHAMEKRQLPDGPNARQRSYLIGRLRKAVKWATLFAELCAIKGDSRTSLEAEVCFLGGYLET